VLPDAGIVPRVRDRGSGFGVGLGVGAEGDWPPQAPTNTARSTTIDPFVVSRLPA